MNGVRRLFGGGTATMTAEDPAFLNTDPNDTSGNTSGNSTNGVAYTPSSGPSWPPPSPSSPVTAKQSSFPSKSAEQRQSPTKRSFDSTRKSRSDGPSRTGPTTRRGDSISSLRSQSTTRKQSSGVSPNNTAPFNTKDELIMELLASEAMVDSQDCEMLNSEQLAELKRELDVITPRLNAATKKLALETKMRDAAASLNKLQYSNSKNPEDKNKKAEALNTAQLKVQNAQTDLSRISERFNEIQRKLLEHRAAVLSYSLRRVEGMLNPSHAGGADSSGRNTPLDSSPTIGTMNLSSRRRFEGAHLYAGHADAATPPSFKAKGILSTTQVNAMEEKLKAAEETAQEADMLRAEVERLRNAQAGLSQSLRKAEDSISTLQAEVNRTSSFEDRLKGIQIEKDELAQERKQLKSQLEDRDTRLREAESRLNQSQRGKRNVEDLERELRQVKETSKADLERKGEALESIRLTLERERVEWDDERQALQDEKIEDLARLQQEMDDARSRENEGSKGMEAELDYVRETLQGLLITHRISLGSSSNSVSVPALTALLSNHMTKLAEDGKRRGGGSNAEWESTRRKLEDDLRASSERRDQLTREVEKLRNETRNMEERLGDPYGRRSNELARPNASRGYSLNSDPGSSSGGSEDIDRVMSVLRGLWNMLPSREARLAKTSARSATPPSPIRSPGRSALDSPSLADLDVRALKALYDPRSGSNSPLFNSFSNPADFNLDAFAQRVQSLLQDDRAIIERLLRFAQAHDLLKNNAERAQKLAQESSMGLETYQKQVKALEDRNAMLVRKQAELVDEVATLQGAIEDVKREKRRLEVDAADKAVTLSNLTDVNNKLSARTLALAQEVSSAPEATRIKMESQLNDMKRKLKEAEEEVNAMRASEQSLNTALMEELNTAQQENTRLMNQLRAEQKKNGGK